MTLPRTDTIVTYPAGALTGTASVLHVQPVGGDRFVVLLDATPCHPVDAGWPDQGPDRATLAWDGGMAAVTDCVVAATDGSTLYLGGEVPVRKGAAGWAFVVAHVLEEAQPVGQEVTVTVDADHRLALSLGHTGCHLAALALNRSMALRWRKDPGRDGLGYPNFDAAANTASRILPRGSLDTYRLNKSLRRKGFNIENLEAELPELQAALNESLTGWIAGDSPVRIERDGDRLTDRRYWMCALPEGEARIACGGTHAGSLGELGALQARLSLADDAGTPVLRMVTGVAG